MANVKEGVLTNGKRYALGVKVTIRGNQADLAATLDGKPIVSYSGPWAALSAIRPPPHPTKVALGAFEETVFHSVKFRGISASAPSRKSSKVAD